MKEMTILMQAPEDRVDRIRVGCRGILVRDGKLLLSYETKKDWYFIPGGGLEEGETLEEGCLRELEEETGIVAQVQEHLLTVNCIYRGVNFRNHFFVCQEVGVVGQHLTEQEANNELVPRFMPLDEAMELFSGYTDFPEELEAVGGCYHRDLEVLRAYQAWATNHDA